jgi:CheY-like chemotaxis protein
MEEANSTAELIEALSKWAWPVFVAFVAIRLFPYLIEIIKSRPFKLKVGDLEVSVQEASEQLRKQVGDLQEQMAAIRVHYPQIPLVNSVMKDGSAVEANPYKEFRPRVLWVTGSFNNHAYELANIREHADVETVKSTNEAINKLRAHMHLFNAVISGMSREEEGEQNYTAGISLISKAREIGYEGPIYIFCSEENVRAHGKEAVNMGAEGVTSSPVQVFEWLRKVSCKIE